MAKKIKKSLPWLLFLAIAAVIIGANFWLVLKAGANVETPTTSGVVGNSAPTVSEVNLTDADGGDIGLNANTTTTVYCTGIITDVNSGADIGSCTAVIYRSGVTGGADCTPDNNDCYSVTGGSCVLGSAVGNDKDATATAYVYFYADPTDNGTYAQAQGWDSETWQCQLKGIDTQDASSTATDSISSDMTTLPAVVADTSITYDTLSPSSTMANLTAILNSTTTGNCPIDVQVKGDDMTYGATGTITVGNQRYSTTTDDAWANGIQLTDTYADLEMDMGKPTSSPSTSTDIVYWGWNVPAGTPMGTYTGTNYVNAVED